VLSQLKSLKKFAFYSAKPEICMDVAAWAKERNLPVLNLHPPLYDDLVKYGRNNLVAQGELSHHKEALSRSQSLITISGAIVRDADGLVELPDGKICYEGNWWIGYLERNPSYRKRFEFRRRFIKGDVFSLISLWSPTYYHWFHDVLPKLETSMPMLPQGISYLINENPKEYQISSLEAFGISGDKLIEQPQAMYSKCERLWFSTPLGHTGLTSGDILIRVADKIRSKITDSNSLADRNGIYISRKFAATRRILNEDSLLPLFNKFQMEIVYSEKHSFEEQVKKFHSSRCIIGPHGAGLTNTMFCKSGSLVVELATENMGIHYMTSSLGMGMDYHKVLCSPVSAHDFNSDMYVNPENIEKCLLRYFGRN